MSLEESVNLCMKNVITLFMEMQNTMILLANATDQSVDDEEDFRICCEAEFKCLDIVDQMCYLIAELPEIAADIRDKPPSPAAKAWWVEKKAERKIAYAALTARRKTAAAEDKLARKAMKEETKEAK